MRKARTRSRGDGAQRSPRRAANTLRIIGGQWRGRKLSFADLPGLRPTPDRVRETLFNWLAFEIPGARCLDLFSGSGALGLEALSREAGQVCFVDSQAQVTRQLEQLLNRLQCQRGAIHQQDALSFLRQAPPPQPFDIVFLDPPFRQGLLAPCCELLESRGWLAPQAWIYVECESELADFGVPANWHVHRQKSAGQVRYSLFQRAATVQTTD